jgi:hypothetical protein
VASLAEHALSRQATSLLHVQAVSFTSVAVTFSCTRGCGVWAGVRREELSSLGGPGPSASPTASSGDRQRKKTPKHARSCRRRTPMSRA